MGREPQALVYAQGNPHVLSPPHLFGVTEMKKSHQWIKMTHVVCPDCHFGSTINGVYEEGDVVWCRKCDLKYKLGETNHGCPGCHRRPIAPNRDGCCIECSH